MFQLKKDNQLFKLSHVNGKKMTDYQIKSFWIKKQFLLNELY